MCKDQYCSLYLLCSYCFVSRVTTLKSFILVRKNIKSFGTTVAEAESGLEEATEWLDLFPPAEMRNDVAQGLYSKGKIILPFPKGNN